MKRKDREVEEPISGMIGKYERKKQDQNQFDEGKSTGNLKGTGN
jgi:hypothetical protein